MWHVISFGQTEGNHVVTFNGNNVIIDGVNRDSHVIISGVGFSAVMKPDNVGMYQSFTLATLATVLRRMLRTMQGRYHSITEKAHYIYDLYLIFE